MKGRLILFPVPIGGALGLSLPEGNKALLDGCRHFIVEELRTARRFLRTAGYAHAIDDAVFYELNEHTRPEDVSGYLDAAERGEDVGLLSEAGLPCVADPGMLATRLAQQKNITVLPLVGPSSLMMALMASGLNGQRFAFNGYLPVDRTARSAALRRLEAKALKDDETQLLIEAPYRNDHMLEALSTTLHPDTLVCVACDIMLPTQQILTRRAADWQTNRPTLHKRNTVFLIGRG